MSNKTYNKIATNPTLIWGLATGVIIPVGILSYWGTMILYPSQALAWAAFFLNGVVDGEVYLDNISGGLKDPQYLGHQGVHALIVKELDKYISKNIPDANSSNFEKDYYNWRLYVQNNPQDIEAGKRIRRMQKYFVQTVLLAHRNEHLPPNALLTHAVKQIPTIYTKRSALRVGAAISLMAGIGFGFVTASSLATVAAMSSWSLPITWPLALTASIGYSFLTFHNMKRILFSDTFDKWLTIFRDWFTLRREQHLFNYFLVTVNAAILVPAAIILGTIATLTTGYTWWIAIENKKLKSLLVPFAIFSNLLFAIKNSMDSVKEMQNGLIAFLKKPFAGSKERIIESFKKENILQLLNPFRFLEKSITVTFDYVLLITHSMAVALTGDQYPGYEKLSLGANSLADFIIDKGYMGGHDHSDHHSHCHQPKNKLVIEDEDDHHHHVIPNFLRNKILKPLLSPLRYTAAAWDAFFSQLNAKRPVLSWKQAKIKHHVVERTHTHTHPTSTQEKPPISAWWIEKEIRLRANKERERIKNWLSHPHTQQAHLDRVDEIESRLVNNIGTKEWFFTQPPQTTSSRNSSSFENRTEYDYSRLSGK